MKKINQKNDYMNMYSNEYNSIDLDPNENNNDNLNKIKKDDSLDKYFNPIEESHESEDILKKLDNLNFSEETSFEMPQKTFEPLTQNIPKQKDKKINNNNIKEKEKLSKEDLITENKDDYNIYKDDINYNNINNIENDNNDQFILNNNNENNKKELTEYSLKEKLNRICLSLQGYTLKPKCYENLNNLIKYKSKTKN